MDQEAHVRRGGERRGLARGADHVFHPGAAARVRSPARRTPARAAVSRVGSLASACSARAPSPLPSTASGSSRAALEALLMASGGAAHGLLRCRGRLDALQLPAVGGGALRAAGRGID